jgi:hypothetical protein
VAFRDDMLHNSWRVDNITRNLLHHEVVVGWNKYKTMHQDLPETSRK